MLFKQNWYKAAINEVYHHYPYMRRIGHNTARFNNIHIKGAHMGNNGGVNLRAIYNKHYQLFNPVIHFEPTQLHSHSILGHIRLIFNIKLYLVER